MDLNYWRERRSFLKSWARCSALALVLGMISGCLKPDGAGVSAATGSTVTDTTPPTLTGGLTNDSAPTRSKTWSWGCDEAPCTYLYSVDTNPTATPTGSYVPTTTATQASGNGTYYLHIIAKDAAGNASAVQHFSAVLDNTAPTLSGLSNDSTLTASKTWSWACSGETGCTYLYVIDTNPATTPTGSYVPTTTATQASGNGTYYLHILAKDLAGNNSTVGHYSAVLGTGAPSLIHVDVTGARGAWGGDGLPTLGTGTISINAVASSLSNLLNESGTATGVGVTITGYEAAADDNGDAQMVMSDFVSAGKSKIVASISGLPAGTHSFYAYPCADPNLTDSEWGMPFMPAPVVLKRQGSQQGSAVTPSCSGWANGDGWVDGDNVVKFTTTVTSGQTVSIEIGTNLGLNMDPESAWALGGMQIHLYSP